MQDAQSGLDKPLPTQEEIERESSKLSTAVKALIALALAKQLASPNVPQGPDVDVLDKAAIVTAMVFLLAKRKYDVDFDVLYGPSGRSLYTQRLADTASRWSRDHAAALQFQVPTMKKRRSWEEAASQSLSTSLMSQAMSDVADQLNQNVRPRQRIKKVWVTRGDHRVRHTHRRLHGESHHLRTPFRVWPITGQKMMYPGDNSAPLSETINCRCYLWLTKGTANQIQQIVASAEPDDHSAVTLDLSGLTVDELFPNSDGARALYREQMQYRIGNTVQR